MSDQPLERGAVRQQRKRRTRQALLDAALGFLEDESFSSISLRQVTREAGVPQRPSTATSTTWTNWALR